jgi:hypothetical protein
VADPVNLPDKPYRQHPASRSASGPCPRLALKINPSSERIPRPSLARTGQGGA